jgi:hypothetical protein
MNAPSGLRSPSIAKMQLTLPYITKIRLASEGRGLDDCAVSESIGAHERAENQKNVISLFPISRLKKS